MKIQERYLIEIVDMGTEGEGIGRAEGIAVFVPGAVTGDRALVEITQVKKNFARGKIVELSEPSSHRVEAACPHAGQCGGCSLSSVSYAGQLELKKKWVVDRLSRIGGIDAPPVEDVIGMTAADYFELVSEEPEDDSEDLALGDGIEASPAGMANPESPVSPVSPFAQSHSAGRQAAAFIGDFPVRYRNKAQFPVRAGRMKKNKDGKYRNEKPCSVGFYKPRSHEIVHCESCAIQSEPAEVVAAVVKRYVDENTVSVFDEKSHMGLLRHVVVRSAFATGEVMVILVVNGNHLPKIELLVEMLDEAVNSIPGGHGAYGAVGAGTDAEPFWSLESVVINVNKAKGSEVMGKECITVAGKSVITDYLDGLRFEISPLSFYQVNPVQMKKLYDKVVEFAQLTGEETVLDLYCGVGTIGLYCASKAKRVIGVESVKSAALNANRNAVINGIVNAEYIYGRAEEILPKRLSGIKADVVILDPPRSGCEPALLAAVKDIAPARIVFVSCDPATLARDLKILVEDGYRVERVQPVDMFPGGGHCEVCVELCRK